MILPHLLLAFLLLSPTVSIDNDSTTQIFYGKGGKTHDYEETTLTSVTNSLNHELLNSTSFERDSYNLAYYRTLPEYKAYLFFIDYFFYFTSIPGLITNPLSIYVAVKIHPTTTSEVHMCVLGIADTFVVSTRIILNLLRFYEFKWTDITCKTIFYVNNTFYVLSNWILVSWTIERCIAVNFPMKMSAWCTVRNVKRVLVLCIVLSTLVLIPHITEAYALRASNQVFCYYSRFYINTYAMIENVIYMYVPIVIIVGCNISIIVKLQQAAKNRLAYTSNHDVLKKRFREQRQMTRVLIIVAGAFLILHLPQVLAKIWQAFYPDQLEIFQYSVRNYIYFVLFTTIGFSITDFQNSINFFLYCVFGTKVRKVLHKTICCMKKENAYLSDSEIKTVSTNI